MTWNQTQNEVSQGGGGTAEGCGLGLSRFALPYPLLVDSHMRFAEFDVAFWAFRDL